jgi:hypothetical protein
VADGEAFKSLKLMTQVPARNIGKMLSFNPYEVEANSSVLFVIERGPIKSVQQLVRTVDPGLNNLRFFTPPRLGTLNAQKFEPTFFCTINKSGGMGSVKCIVVAIPPWDFAPYDFVDFTTMNTVSFFLARDFVTAIYLPQFIDGYTSLNGMRSDPPWNNAYRMWAYVSSIAFLLEPCY